MGVSAKVISYNKQVKWIILVRELPKTTKGGGVPQWIILVNHKCQLKLRLKMNLSKLSFFFDTSLEQMNIPVAK